MLGQVLQAINVPVGAGEVYRTELNIANLPTGAYNVQINDGASTSAQRVMKVN